MHLRLGTKFNKLFLVVLQYLLTKDLIDLTSDNMSTLGTLSLESESMKLLWEVAKNCFLALDGKSSLFLVFSKTLFVANFLSETVWFLLTYSTTFKINFLSPLVKLKSLSTSFAGKNNLTLSLPTFLKVYHL